MLPYIPFRKPHSLLCLFSIHFCSIKKNDLYQLCPCEDPFYELSGHLSENAVVVGQLTMINSGALHSLYADVDTELTKLGNHSGDSAVHQLWIPEPSSGKTL